MTVKSENFVGEVRRTTKSTKTTQKHLVTRYVHSNGCFNVGIFTDLGTGHYLSPGGGSEDFGLNTMKFSRSPL